MLTTLREASADRYAAAFAVEAFSRHGVTLRQDAEPKSAIYLALLPMLTSRTVELLDSPRLLHQLAGLERRRRPGGRDIVDSAPGGHEDAANAAAGVCVLLAARPEPGIIAWMREEADRVRAARGLAD